MAITVDTDAIDRWNRQLAAEPAAIAERVAPVVVAEAAELENVATAMAPTRTGSLRGSIRVTGAPLKRRVAAGSARAYYAGFQEFGTAKMAAHPFLLLHANEGTLAEFAERVGRAALAGAIYRGEG